MREIDYSVWDGKQFHYVPDFNMHFTSNGIIVQLNSGAIVFQEKDNIQEFVGLKDSHGKKIYEGRDIFKFKYLEELHKPIELIGKFVFGEDLSFEIEIITNTPYSEKYVVLHYINNGVFYDFEIISNIHDK